jgi:hypothetical protein
MKKIIFILATILTLSSCGSDVKFNDPSFQGQKDNVLWRADVINAAITGGTLTINAYRGLEVVSLVVPAPTVAIANLNPQVSLLGTDDAISDVVFASYSYEENGISLNYATGKGIGNGKVTITNYDPKTRKLSGSFNFNAEYEGDNQLVPKNLNFQSGFIFNIIVL